MPNVFGDPETVTLGTLITEIGANRFLVPYFQRDFVWAADDIRELMRSLFNEYYVGSLVFWDVPDGDIRRTMECESLWGFGSSEPSDEDEKAEPLVVLDGQQRLTAMHYVFFGSDELLRSTRKSRAQGARFRFFVDIARFYEEQERAVGRAAAFVVREETDGDREMDIARRRRDDLYDETHGHQFPLRLLGSASEHQWLRPYIRSLQSKVEDGESEVAERRSRMDHYEAEAERLVENGNPAQPTNYRRLEERRQALEEAKDKLKIEQKRLKDAEAVLRQLEADRLRLHNAQKQTSKSATRGDNRQALSRLGGLIPDARQTVLAREKDVADAESAVQRLEGKVERRHQTGAQQPASSQQRLELESQYYAAHDRHQKSILSLEEAKRNLANAVKFEGLVRDLRQGYKIPKFTIPAGTDETEVGDIFGQINRRGVQLDTFDLFNASLSLQEIPVGKEVQALAERLRPQGLWQRNSRDTLLRMMVIRAKPGSPYDLNEERYAELLPGARRVEPSSESPLIPDKAEFRKHWDAVKQAYEVGMTVLRDKTHFGTRTPSGPRAFVPFEGMLPVYCSLWAEAHDSPSREHLVAQWYWASVLMGRYASSSDTGDVGPDDYLQVRAWLKQEEGTRVPEALQSFRHAFQRGFLLESERRGPTPFGNVTKGITSLFLTMEPRSLRNGDFPSPDRVVSVPVLADDWYERNSAEGVKDSAFGQVLVTEDVQDLMEKRLPHDYLPEVFENLSEDVVVQVLDSHCISGAARALLMKDQLTADDFHRFLDLREAEFLGRLSVKVFDGLDLSLD